MADLEEQAGPRWDDQGPAPRRIDTAVSAAYGLVDVLRAALRHNSSATIALRLDVEGGEWWLMRQLLRDDPPLLCALSYLFVEFHGAATGAQLRRLPKYALPPDAFEELKRRAHAAMEAPTCRLRLYWRSFWASCGDQQRFEWRNSEQAMT